MLRYMLLLLTLVAVPVALACQVIATKLPLLLAARAAMLGGH